MKSKCSSILKATLALALAVILLVGTMSTGLAKIVDLVGTGWSTQTGGTIYFNATEWYHGVDETGNVDESQFPAHMYMLYVQKENYNDNWGWFQEMSRIENTSMYYISSTSVSNSEISGSGGYRFIATDHTFDTNGSGTSNVYWDYLHDNYGLNDDSTSSAHTCHLSGSLAPSSLTNTSGNIYTSWAYYISPADASEGCTLRHDYSLNGNNRFIDNNSANKCKTQQHAVVLTDEDGDGEGDYAYVGDDALTKGGIVTVNSRVWDGNYSVSAAGDTTMSSFKAQYGNAASGAITTLKVLDVFDGYRFDGWFAYNDTTTPLTTDTTYSYYNVGYDGNTVEHWALFTKTDATESKFYLSGYLNGGSNLPDATDAKLSPTSTEGVYECTYRFIGDHEGYQYITVMDGTIDDDSKRVYHPNSESNSPSGTASDNSSHYDNNAGGDPKWVVHAPAGTEVTFTWDMRDSAAPVLSWKYNTSLIYAKDGVGTSDTSATAKYGYGDIATTKIFAVGGSTAAESEALGTQNDIGVSGTDTHYYTYAADAGTSLTIETTINAANKDRFYVRGWSVNGVTLGGNTTPNASGVYSFNYDIPDNTDRYEIEITPIFYINPTAAAAQGNTLVTFYVNDYDAVSSVWGDTPYAYPYYGNYSNIANSFGVYPGQPLVYENTQYSIQVPVKAFTIDPDVRVVTDTGAITAETGDDTKVANGSEVVKGITVNNGYDDYVHNLINTGITHQQTYDSDAFYKIYNEQKDAEDHAPNYIEMDLIGGITYDNRAAYGTAIDGQTWSYGTDYDDVPPTLNASDITTIKNNRNGWVLYTDRYGRPIDIFGQVITGDFDESSIIDGHDALRVISTGYSSNIAGDNGTAWLVYTPDAGTGYTLVSDGSRKGIAPSVLTIKDFASVASNSYPTVTERTLPDGATGGDIKVTYSDSVDAYTSIYTALDAYKGRYVCISYESPQQLDNGGKSGAVRYDTRWYWSYETDMINANIVIEYWNGISGWVREASYVTGDGSMANQGAVSGCKAYFTNTSIYGKNIQYKMSSGDILIDCDTFTFSASASSRYTFAGWYINDALLGADPTETTFGTTGNATIVARFMLNASGELEIIHSPAAGSVSSDDTHTYVKAEVLDSNGDPLSPSVQYGYSSNVSSVTIPSEYISNTSTNKIKVTLTTDIGEYRYFGDAYGLDAFNTAKSISPNTNSIGNTTATYEFTFDVNDLFSGSTLVYPTLVYTSPIAEITERATYTFTYPARTGGGNVTSTVTGGLLTRTEYKRGSSPALDTSLAARQTDISSVFANKVKIFMQKGEVNPSIGAVDGTTVPVTFTMTDAAPRLTYYYPTGASETAVEITGSTGFYKAANCSSGSAENAYATAPDLYSIMSGKGVSEKQFYAWYEYDTESGTIGDMVSVEKQFGFSIVKDTTVIAVYKDSAFSSDGSWHARIDKNEVTVEPGNAYYNDNLVCFTDYRNTRLSTVTPAPEYGVVLLYRPTEYTGNLSALCTQANLEKFAALTANKHYNKSTSYRVINVTLSNDLSKLSNKNRAIISLQSGYTDTFKGAEYAAVSYVKIGNSYSFSPARTGYYEVVE